MRVLVAGASGAIGRVLVPHLLEAGHTVVGITRRAGSLADTGAQEIVADVSRRAEFLAALDGVRADAVVHQLTALKRPPMHYRDMRTTNRLRHEGTSTLIAAARRVGATKFVGASIFYGYGFSDHGRLPVDEMSPFGEPDGENDAVQFALLSLEQQVRAFGGVTLRYGLVYSPEVKSVSPVPARWRGLLPMLHVSDAAGSVVAALARGKPGEAYNIADDNPMTYRAREKALAVAAGVRPPLVLPDGVLRTAAPFGSQLLTRTSIRMSTDKARRQLGWSPQYPSMEDGLARRPDEG
jgi:nucleoside-diphosphate-sugar epimerase